MKENVPLWEKVVVCFLLGGFLFSGIGLSFIAILAGLQNFVAGVAVALFAMPIFLGFYIVHSNYKMSIDCLEEKQKSPQ
jgi:hypothetical protein